MQGIHRSVLFRKSGYTLRSEDFLGTFLKKFFLQLLPGDISGASYEIMISGIFILCYKSPYCQKTRITVFIDTPHFYRPAFPGCQKIRQVLPVVFINIAVFLSLVLKSVIFLQISGIHPNVHICPSPDSTEKASV